jgi:hypothetical protein
MDPRDDQDNQREIALKGEKARQFLDNPLWKQQWADFEAFIFEQFTKTESRDVELLAHWKRMHVAGLQVKACFERSIAEGRFAESSLAFTENQSRFQKLKAILK